MYTALGNGIAWTTNLKDFVLENHNFTSKVSLKKKPAISLLSITRGCSLPKILVLIPIWFFNRKYYIMAMLKKCSLLLYIFVIKSAADITFVFITDNNFFGLEHFFFAGYMLCFG